MGKKDILIEYLGVFVHFLTNLAVHADSLFFEYFLLFQKKLPLYFIHKCVFDVAL